MRRLLFLSFSGIAGSAKKTPELLQTFSAKYTALNRTLMIERRITVQQMNPASTGSPPRIRHTVHHPRGTAVDHRPRAHRTRFLGDIDRAPLEPPVADSRLRRGDGKHLGVRRCILEHLHLIPAACNNLSLLDDNAAAGNFTRRAGFFCLAQGMNHKLFILRHSWYHATEDTDDFI